MRGVDRYEIYGKVPRIGNPMKGGDPVSRKMVENAVGTTSEGRV